MVTNTIDPKTKAVLNKIHQAGFDKGVISMANCLRHVSVNCQSSSKKEPTLMEMARMIEDAMARRNKSKQ